MSDLFDNVILCKTCGKEMTKGTVVKNGIAIRAAVCKACKKRDFHPLDLERYNEFRSLKRKPFHVKLRLVGNSYAVSIPREIIDFINASDEVVEMQLEEFGRLSLSFKNSLREHEKFIRKKLMEVAQI